MFKTMNEKIRNTGKHVFFRNENDVYECTSGSCVWWLLYKHNVLFDYEVHVMISIVYAYCFLNWVVILYFFTRKFTFLCVRKSRLFFPYKNKMMRCNKLSSYIFTTQHCLPRCFTAFNLNSFWPKNHLWL